VAEADEARVAHATRTAQREQPRLSVPSTIRATPDTQAALPIEVGSAQTLPRNCFIRIRGLPPTVALSEGYSIGPGSWAIPLSGLATLKANIPKDVWGRSEMAITLVGLDGTLLAEVSTELVVARNLAGKESSEPPAKQHTLIPSPASRSDDNPQLSSRAPGRSAGRERAEQLVAQGEHYLSQGKVSGARLFFRQAADAGYALAAIRLAATYDAAELARLQVQGIAPDAAEARKWYERARELGAPEAEERLARLSGN
jgi:hypothetical protein